MSYAANLGRVRIIAMLRALGAQDLQKAFDRACLQGRIETARALFAMGARPAPDPLMGPCETHTPSGLAFLFELGAPPTDAHGDRLAPVAMCCRPTRAIPKASTAAWPSWPNKGSSFPTRRPWRCIAGVLICWKGSCCTTAPLLDRPFAHEDIYPSSLGCSGDHSLALHGTPLAGGTLLHLCADSDEVDMAAIDGGGFGGHTALFGCVVSQPYRNGNKSTALARLLIEYGARTDVRANVRKRPRFVDGESMHECRDVTPLAWGRAFHDQAWVNPAVLELLG